MNQNAKNEKPTATPQVCVAVLLIAQMECIQPY